jgi:tetratricopeptide (TPR) repeat protein
VESVFGYLVLESDRRRASGVLTRLRSGEASMDDLSPEDLALVDHGPLLDLLLERSCAARYDDPARMIQLARAACAFAKAMPTSRYGQEVVEDLRARTWAELGNSYRVADQMEKAEAAFARARVHLLRGTGAPALAARVGELAAALFTDLRRFDEADEVYQRAAEVYRGLHLLEARGRVLVRMGLLRGYVGEPERGIIILLTALKSIPPDSPLRLPAIHGLALNLVDSHMPDAAEKLVKKYRRLYHRAGKLNRIRLFWLEGKIAFGLGKHGTAEAKLNTARLAFAHEEQDYDAALVSLDLALVHLRCGRRKETVWLVNQMLSTFRRLGIAREVIASLIVLRKSLSADRSTDSIVAQVETISRVVSELGRGRTARRSTGNT